MYVQGGQTVTVATAPPPTIVVPVPAIIPQTVVMENPAFPIPQPFVLNGVQYPESPMKALQELDSIDVSQKPQWLEAAGCEFEKIYNVYGTTFKTGKIKKDKHEKIFKCKEHSTCCQRYFVPY